MSEKSGEPPIQRGAHGKFAVGVSGNPSGRPRTLPSASTPRWMRGMMLNIFHETFSTQINGRTVKMPLIEVLMRKLVSKVVAEGDVKELRDLLELCAACAREQEKNLPDELRQMLDALENLVAHNVREEGRAETFALLQMYRERSMPHDVNRRRSSRQAERRFNEEFKARSERRTEPPSP